MHCHIFYSLSIQTILHSKFNKILSFIANWMFSVHFIVAFVQTARLGGICTQNIQPVLGNAVWGNRYLYSPTMKTTECKSRLLSVLIQYTRTFLAIVRIPLCFPILPKQQWVWAKPMHYTCRVSENALFDKLHSCTISWPRETFEPAFLTLKGEGWSS
jgi:hypothetical protein